MTDNKYRILSILRATGRPGVDAVINYLESSSYFKRGCYSHHKAGYTVAQIAPLFAPAVGIPNVLLPAELVAALRGNEYIPFED